MEARQIRAMAIISKGDMPLAVSKEEFLISSQCNASKKYKVIHKQSWKCECEDYRQRKVTCKHILATQFWIKMRAKADADSTFDVNESILDNDICVYCKSSDIAKNGTRKTETGEKQRFLCKSCNRTFITDKDMGKIKGNVKVVVMVIDLYLKGVSLRKIKDHLQQFYSIDVNHETIRRWILKFTARMNQYVANFKPKTSEMWHADEQMIKARTQHKKGGSAYIWNVLDADTRFLIASKVTEARTRDEAKDIFVKAKQKTKKPKVIVTDKFRGYGYGINQAFKGKVEHHAHKGLVAHVQNNKIERFHNTFRERDKTMRGFKSVETANVFNQTFQTYYNYIRPHTTLGMTPAEKANINLQLGQNKWLSLIKQASVNA